NTSDVVLRGVDFVEKLYKHSERDVWLSDKPNLGLDFPNLPYYIDGDVKISQSKAILKYLARKHGLVARDDRELIKQEIVAEQLRDIRMKFLMGVVFSDKDPADTKDGYITGVLIPHLNDLVKFLGDKQWLTTSLSYVDFLAYELLDWFRLFTPETIAKYPVIGQYLDRFEALPTINSYQSSAKYRQWPVFSPGAKWGYNKL
ncbi:unnamed protein product, partial [Oppiella nova]